MFGVNGVKRILVLEDEDTIREFIVINLQRSGYDVTEVTTGEDAIRIFDEQQGEFDIALLDIMLPGIDGFDVCKYFREKNNKIGIIMLTARTQEMDKVSGLMIGADDYVTKPFSPSELVARVDSLYRRVSMTHKNISCNEIKIGPFVLNTRNRTLHKSGEQIDLTQVEYQIMEYLMSNAGMALDRTDILNNVWGEGFFKEVKVVDVNIRRLRMKIEDDPSDPKYIQTMWGFGYRFSAE